MRKPSSPPGMMLEKYRGDVPAWDGEPDIPYESFFEPIHLRDNIELQQALAASTDRRFREFLNQMQMHMHKRRRLSSIAKILDIPLSDFIEFLRSAYHTRAMSIAAARLPLITEHIADDALTQKEACARCDGWGFVNVTPEEVPPLEEGQPIPGGVRPMGTRFVRDCPRCDGSGKTRKAGDAHARDKILIMNGIGIKGAGVTVAINNYGGHGIEAAGNRMNAVTFDISAEGADGEIVHIENDGGGEGNGG